MAASLALQKAAQEAYRNKNYPLALQLLTKALTLHPTVIQQIGILDNRAAAFEKSTVDDSLKRALADAKTIIKLQRSSPRGYLRAGKVLQLMNEVRAAVDIYQHGLKYLHPDDQQGRKLLNVMHQKALHRTGKTSGIDPFSVFPYEIVVMILDYLPFQTLMRLQRVSKAWRAFLTTSPGSYRVLDFSSARSVVSKLTIRTYIQRAGGYIEKVILGKTKFTRTETLVYLAQRCKQLSELHITGDGLLGSSIPLAAKAAENLKVLVLACTTTVDSVVETIRHTRKLETFLCENLAPRGSFRWDIEEVRPLKHLRLRWQDSCAAAALDTDYMFTSLANLRHLEIINPPTGLFTPAMDFVKLAHLQDLKYTHTDLVEFPALPVNLLHLDLSGSSSLQWRTERIVASPLPLLESLKLAMNGKVTNDRVLEILAPSCDQPRLRVLSLAMCPRIDVDSLQWLIDAGHGETVEELSLAGLPSFGDQVTKELRSMRNLTRLDISCTRVSGIGVINLVENGAGRLRWLDISLCDAIGRDAVDLLREKGVTIISKSNDLKGGKKIRYRD